MQKSRSSADFEALAVLLKRVNNITKGYRNTAVMSDLRARLKEPAELALADEIDRRFPAIAKAALAANYSEAMRELAALHKPVDRFFVDVLVMADDVDLRDARLTLLTTLKEAIREWVGDIAAIAPEDVRQA